MWFNILKVLGTKSGFSQLDFDNIVIEDEDNCKTRWQKICDELSKVRIEGYPNDRRGSSTSFGLKDNSTGYDGDIGYLEYIYSEKIPEEVYCFALDLLEAGKDAFKRFDDEPKGWIVSFSKQDDSYYNKYECYLMISHSRFGRGSASIGYITNTERPSIDGLDMEAEVLKLLPKLKEAFPY